MSVSFRFSQAPSEMSRRPFSPLALAIVLALASCASRPPAPVSERATRPAGVPSAPVSPAAKPAPVAAEMKGAGEGKTHAVQKGETLIAIALQYGLDYRELALWNNIENPNVIQVGMVLRVVPPGSAVAEAAPGQPKPGQPVATPLGSGTSPSAAAERPPTNTAALKVEPRGGKLPYSEETLARLEKEAAPAGTTSAQAPSTPAASTAPATPAPAATGDDVDWSWPVKGKLLATFTDANKGIDISGSKGAPVLAAAPGKVVYSGSGLRGYGRLVIVKHNATWLSAYAHNERILVNEGQEVQRGQKIAEMGSSDTDQVKLHFEIRKQGKPLDPLKFLPKP